MSGDTEREALTEVIRTVTDLWDEPLDNVHDVPPIVNAILAEFLPAYTERVKAEAAHDALMAEADAIENYTLIWTPGGGVRLDHILGLLRRDAGIRRES